MNNDFKAAINGGLRAVSETVCDDFEYNGEVFKGSFKAGSVDSSMVMAGYNSSADYIVRAPREQFAGTVPPEKSAITWQGVELFVAADMDPLNQFSWVAAVRRRVR